MDKRLLNYKETLPIDYLDGRYFHLVLRDIPGVIQQPLILRVSHKGASIVSGPRIDPSQGIQYLRLIIEFVENVDAPQDQGRVMTRASSAMQLPTVTSQGKVVSRHSNLLIIDNPRKRIQRFEPLDDNAADGLINQELMRALNPTFAGYDYRELSIHPQKDDLIGLCVAYVIKFAYFHHHEGAVSFEGDYDIAQFGKAIVKQYGVVDDRNKDIEFGYHRYGYGYSPLGGAAPILGGALLGGIVGGAIAGGPGFAAGALTGGLAGGIAAAPYY